MTVKVVCMCVLRKTDFREKLYVEDEDLDIDSLKVFLSMNHLESLFHPQKFLDLSMRMTISVHLKQNCLRDQTTEFTN